MAQRNREYHKLARRYDTQVELCSALGISSPHSSNLMWRRRRPTRKLCGKIKELHPDICEHKLRAGTFNS